LTRHPVQILPIALLALIELAVSAALVSPGAAHPIEGAAFGARQHTGLVAQGLTALGVEIGAVALLTRVDGSIPAQLF
jgi:hypothetical protein